MEDLFKIYLEFCPFYRRVLFHIKDLHKWVKSLEIGHWLKDYNNFFIFLDFLYQQKIIIPFFKRTKLERGPRIRFVEEEGWKTEYDNENIKFIDSEENFESHLEYLEVLDDRFSNYNDYLSLMFQKMNLYYYHPLQFIQILSFFHTVHKRGSHFLQFRDFHEFFYTRLSNPNPQHIRKQDGINDYIKEMIEEKENPFYVLKLKSLLKNIRWLDN